MLTTKKKRLGEYKVFDGKRLVGMVRRTSRNVQRPGGKARILVWVALTFAPNLLRIGPPVGTKREAVSILENLI